MGIYHYNVYISALSALPGGTKVHGSTTDKRLLRRIVRDNRVRGISPEENILRWPSVRRGETHNIFPFEENARVVFNSSTLYDLPLLKYYAEPLLYGVTEASLNSHNGAPVAASSASRILPSSGKSARQAQNATARIARARVLRG